MMIFSSERLDFTEWKEKDASFLFFLNSDEEVVKYTGDVPFKSESEALELILNYDQYDKYGFGRWMVLRKSDQSPIGWCGLSNREGVIDIGFRFLQSEWGKGYATEAANRSLDFAFNELKIDSVVGRAAKDNIGSWKVLEKIGMKRIETNDCHGIPAWIYSISAQEYKNR